MNNKEISGLRVYYNLPSSVSDAEIKAKLNRSLGLTVIRIEKAKKDLSKAFQKSLPEIIRCSFRR